MLDESEKAERAAKPVPSVRRTSRRDLLKALAALGVGTAVFHRALAAVADGAPALTRKMIRRAEWISGISLTGSELALMDQDLAKTLTDFSRIRSVPLDNSVAPSLYFHPAPHAVDRPPDPGPAPTRETPITVRPREADELAALSVSELGRLLRTRRLSSVELTGLYLDRLERYDPQLRCVITSTEDLAREQALRADREIAAGDYRGPLHGIPWGVKDLFALPGYPTTWGAMPFKDQVRSEKATVVARLERAGAPLLAKLSVGALAWGDVWYDGMTRNPWNPDQGSSGSSAGSAAATAASCVGFAIGTETWGSIVSPCTRCGVTGLRPTFGRVSRHGAMALSWSMDKVGPIARSVEDCALIFRAIHGADGLDPSAIDRPFEWPPRRDPRSLRIGFVRSLFEEDRTADVEDETARAALAEWAEHDRRTLDVLREAGVDLRPIELPDRYPVDALAFILTAEAATAFDSLTRSGRDDLLVRQIRNAWPNVFRQGQFIPAVEYLRANRIRTLLLQELERALEGFDAYVVPSFGGNNLLLTNLTGHPSVVVPNGFRTRDQTPTSITFVGRLYGETDLLSAARLYQEATEHHLRRPALDPKPEA